MTKKKAIIIEKRSAVNSRLIFASESDIDDVFEKYGSGPKGLSEEKVEENRDEYGNNIVIKDKKDSLLKRLYLAFINPFTAILLILTIVSTITDIILPPPGEKDWLTVTIIMTMVIVSGILRLVQETRSNNAAEKLSHMVRTTTCVERDGNKIEIPLDEVVAGDIIHLAAGDIFPADVRIIKSKDLFVSQSSLTGESEPIEKRATLFKNEEYGGVTERDNLAFMGSTVISGSGKAIVTVVGEETLLGQVAKTLQQKPAKTSFEKGINSVSWVLIRFMLAMVPVVLLVNGFTKGDWVEALLFAISVAVGLTPEMLPMIVTACLAKGATKMSKKKTIIKNLNAIQNFGAMDILCTDKTGTLTQDKIILERHLDVHGNNEPRVLKHAFLNSYFQTGLKNLLDVSIIEKTEILSEEYELLKNLTERYEKLDEIPFDFSRRRMSVVVRDDNGKRQLITKGAVEEILSICSHVEYKREVMPLTEELKAEVMRTVNDLNDEGMRVIAVAQKTSPPRAGAFDVEDECDMVLIGYLSFLDPPKETTKAAVKALKDYGVEVKILTGDNDRVTAAICRKVGISIRGMLLGTEIAEMDDEELSKKVEKTNVFAKLSPDQKVRIVTILRSNKHVVGFMGDGINDAAAMKAADVGISVDTAVDISKESADIILLEKDLMVLEQGIIEGRKIYANMIKYIKLTASSNFGNMFSVLAASAFLPFLPMLPVHLIFLNLVYDLSCVAIPWDNVDKEFLTKPRMWESKSVTRFMMWFGPTSSVFDITIYLLLFFVICPQVSGGAWGSASGDPALFAATFHAGWFIQSMWTQTLVIHLIRTEKIPFVQSRAAWPVTLITFAGIGIVTAIPFTPIGGMLAFGSLPAIFFAYLFAIIAAYMGLVILVKYFYVKRYQSLL